MFDVYGQMYAASNPVYCISKTCISSSQTIGNLVTCLNEAILPTAPTLKHNKALLIGSKQHLSLLSKSIYLAFFEASRH